MSSHNVPAITTATTTTTSMATSPSPILLASRQLLYAFHMILCTTMLLLGNAFVSINTQNVLSLVALPIIFVSTFTTQIIMSEEEPSHLLFHFILFLSSFASILHSYVPFTELFEKISESKPVAGTIAWILLFLVVLVTVISLDWLFYAIVTIPGTELGWYGSFHEGFQQWFYSACRMVYRGTANGLLDLGVGIGKHWTAIMERLQGALNEGNEVMATSPSNEPLLNGAVNESEASLLPSYSHEMNVDYDGKWYGKFETAIV